MKKIPRTKSLIEYFEDINSKFENNFKYQLFFVVTMGISYLLIMTLSFLIFPFYSLYSKIILNNYNNEIVKLHFYSMSNSIIKTEELSRLNVSDFIDNYIPNDLSKIFVKWEKINDLDGNHSLDIGLDNFYIPVVKASEVDSDKKQTNNSHSSNKKIKNNLLEFENKLDAENINDNEPIIYFNNLDIQLVDDLNNNNTKKLKIDNDSIEQIIKPIKKDSAKSNILFNIIKLDGVSHQIHQENINNLNVGDKILFSIIHNNNNLILVTDISDNKLGYIPKDLNNEYLHKINENLIIDAHVHEIIKPYNSKYKGLRIILNEKDVKSNLNVINKSEDHNNYVRPNSPFYHYFDQSNGNNNAETKITALSVSGVKYYNRQEMIIKLNKGDSLILIRQPDNPYDSYAILVCDNQLNELGYIPRYLSKYYSDKLQNEIILNVLVNKIDYSRGKVNPGLSIHIYEKINTKETVPIKNVLDYNVKNINVEIEVMGTENILIQKRLRSTYKNDVVSLHLKNEVFYVKNKLNKLLGYIKLTELQKFNIDLDLITSYNSLVSKVYFNNDNTLMLLFITISNKTIKIKGNDSDTIVKNNKSSNIYIQDNFIEDDLDYYISNTISDLNRTIMDDFEKNELFNQDDFEPPIDFEF